MHTYGEDPLGLASRAHVGVVDLLEDHPGLVVFAHLQRGGGGGGRGRGGRLLPQMQGHTLSFPHKSVSYLKQLLPSVDTVAKLPLCC